MYLIAIYRNDILHRLQQEDVFCKNILNQMEKGNIIDGQLYLVRDKILKRYVLEGTTPLKPLQYQKLSLLKYLEWLMTS